MHSEGERYESAALHQIDRVLIALVALAVISCSVGRALTPTRAGGAARHPLSPFIPMSAVADARCPPLPPPTDPTVTVSSEAELRDRAYNAAPGTTVLVTAGTYNMQSYVHIVNDGIAIRGATGDRDDVILDFGGMTDGYFGILVEADDVTIADLTIRNATDHGVSMETNWSRSTPGVMGARTGCWPAPAWNTPPSRPTSTPTANGISAHNAHRWVVRDNEWYRIRTPGNTPVPTVLFWSGSSDTIVERNLLVDCYQGISFGNASQEGINHTGGIVRNNFIYASMPHDVVIEMVRATGWLVAHNTALLLNPDGVTWGMEARFSESQGTFAT